MSRDPLLLSAGSAADVLLLTAPQNLVPIAVTAAESVERLRGWASGRCLSADSSPDAWSEKIGIAVPSNGPISGRPRKWLGRLDTAELGGDNISLWMRTYYRDDCQ